MDTPRSAQSLQVSLARIGADVQRSPIRRRLHHEIDNSDLAAGGYRRPNRCSAREAVSDKASFASARLYSSSPRWLSEWAARWP